MRRFRDILAVCDEESAYEHTFERLCWLGTAEGTRITLVDVVSSGGGDVTRLFRRRSGEEARQICDEIVAQCSARLEDMADVLRARQIRVRTVVLIGDPVVEITRQAMRQPYDLVLKGAQRSRARPFLSDPDIRLLRKCPVPVWILNTSSEDRAHRILAAVDPNPEDPTRDELSHEIMEQATALAARDGAWLDVLHAWHLPEEHLLRRARARVPSDEVDELLAEEQRRSQQNLYALTNKFAGRCDMMRVVHVKGIASDTILDHVETDGIDTIVMGTVGRSGVAGIVPGNTSETIIKNVACSVLTVKPKSFVSPVAMQDEYRICAE